MNKINKGISPKGKQKLKVSKIVVGGNSVERGLSSPDSVIEMKESDIFGLQTAANQTQNRSNTSFKFALPFAKKLL